MTELSVPGPSGPTFTRRALGMAVTRAVMLPAAAVYPVAWADRADLETTCPRGVCSGKSFPASLAVNMWGLEMMQSKTEPMPAPVAKSVSHVKSDPAEIPMTGDLFTMATGGRRLPDSLPTFTPTPTPTASASTSPAALSSSFAAYSNSYSWCIPHPSAAPC